MRMLINAVSAEVGRISRGSMKEREENLIWFGKTSAYELREIMLKIEALTFWGRETGHHMWFASPKRSKRLQIGQTYCDITQHGMILFTVEHGQRDIPFSLDGVNKR